ncbi:SusC/RagA family TonB-linked outer membrane protein [Dyadobacter aurulentus]|uniref:SusC/RagA family TonB-linked outer membrane protein n=1 Tax=Dyadobacter sp. UC 10 TaxID=2605428 RepID=UPI0011F26BE3|nr:TonB-dependent receptor [Dyadobacter sp. UC 10]KAA0992795.1 TonB-dependent receptor [Dyadobacter sp. UC 10]
MKISLIQTVLAVIFTGLSIAGSADAQDLLNQKITIRAKNQELVTILKNIEKLADVKFTYRPELIRDAKKLSVEAEASKLADLLDEILQPLDIKYKIVRRQVILTKVERSQSLIPEIAPLQLSSRAERELTGKVLDEKNSGLPGVSVVIKGTQKGTTTDIDGSFKLALPDEEATNAVLVFSFVGYQSQEVPVRSSSVITVSLAPEDRSLNEIVVVGYGTVKKSDITGSVAQVKSKDINSFPTSNALQALSGRAAGVQVTQNNGSPGAGMSVRIRGTNSIQGSNDPLYVVDGFPTTGNNPTILNSVDIESMEILKDASATAIYGSRGANGVVLITTKQGKAGKTRVDIETSYSSQTLRKKLELMNASEYARFYNMQAANDKLAPYFTDEQVNNFGEGFDWQDQVFRRAPIKSTSITVSGGNEKTQFSISGSFFGQDGIIKGSDYDRYSLRTNFKHSISKKISFTMSTTLSRLKTARRDSEGGSRGNSMISAAISSPPTLTPYNEDGSYRVMATAYPFIATDLINPLNFINEQTNVVKANRILSNAAFIYNPIPEIAIKISGGIENADDRTDIYTTRKFVNSNGNATVRNTQATSFLNENTISYNKTFNEIHSVSAVAGFTYQDFLTTSLSGAGTGFLSDITETSGLGSAATPGIPGSGYSKAVLLSYLGRVNYALKDKYLFTASIRRDGSSRYSKGEKWGYFPSGAVAWRISNEDFLKNNSNISDLKLRASWGLTGSQAIDPYATLNQLEAGRTVFDDAMYPSFTPETTLPGNLKWETTEQKDIGIDMGILKNRVLLSADFYIKNTRNLLNRVTLPSSLGYTSTIRNVGEMRNQGLEFGVDSRIFTGEFKWDLNTNISFNRNKVVKLYGNDDILGGSVGVVVINDVTSILREGRPVGQFWGYIENGYTEQGKLQFQDLDNDGNITQNDKTYIGNPNPDFIYGINSNMSYKGFDLTLFIQGVQGNDLFNVSSIVNTIDYGFGLNMPKEVLYNHWTPENPNAKYPLITRNSNARVSDRFIEDGSYLRLRNIQLAYNLPLEKWGVKSVRNVQLYVSAQNLLTFTKYSWWDPEVNSKGGGNVQLQGIDHNSYPTAKSFTAGLRVGF